jgi:hypothetical protein
VPGPTIAGIPTLQNDVPGDIATHRVRWDEVTLAVVALLVLVTLIATRWH